ncbi:MerR family transcriptional regulator [Jiangella sp. DSM 45060]|uniref:MerR family transcriptional regulator n=1 Tax=Jiangella sp. DSM 45060 TaxID=1798224 RepID=UPI00087D4770|nr:MerR family transcriptional regulator [Jiangella sp. DSM 45060]SDT72189.1 DNA-binding transcriptional regulator, MerR family [Jiangella sp. DSM 45060]
MRSSELAALAGVTVRALRHYHQVGVLDEPPRKANGYRAYDVHHLIRVLRIKRLTALGFPLAALPGLLDQPDADAVELLDQLDDELAGQIQRLEARRAVVAELRRDRAAPDLPHELARHLAAWADADAPATLARIDREQTILVAHLVGEENLPRLSQLYERMTAPDVVAASRTLYARMDALGPGSDDAEIERLADDLAAMVAPIAAEFQAASDDELDLDAVAPLLSAYTGDVLNEAQRRVLALVESRLSAPA